MADVSIKYKGAEKAALNASGSKTIKTSGKYCEADIVVEYTDPEKATQSKTLTLGAAAPGTVSPDSGKVLSSVPVSIDSTVIKAENIKRGVTMLGITGTHSGGITPTGTKSITENGTYDVANYANAKVDVGGIPSTYTQLEYIASSGTQYIDTGVLPTENCVAEIDFELTGYQNTSYMALVSASTHMYLCHFAHSSGSDIMFVPNWYTYGAPNNYKILVMNHRYKSLCHIYNCGGLASAQTGEFSIKHETIQSYTPTNNFFIFVRNNGSGTVSYNTKAKLYALKMWTDGVLRRDFVPAMSNSDSTIGLYDRVSNSFFTNIGTGTFTGGALA